MHQSYDSFDENRVQRRPKVPGARSITELDKTLIMGQVEELFAARRSRDPDAHTGSGPVTQEDKNLIMWNVDELFLV